VGERDVAFELDVTMRGLGAEGVAFDTIVAFGENAAEPHHRPTERPLAKGDLVKMDFGCVVSGYRSDMTRTVAFGRPDAKLEEVYELVRRAQRAGLEAVRAGAACQDVDRATRAPIEEAGYGENYGHGAGHGVGLEIHEAPWLLPRTEESLPEGAVVTVEPGVYLEEVGGVRIEDMVEVTADGGRVLARTTKELMVL
jgi:Xaa-Pro aminopeptidase